MGSLFSDKICRAIEKPGFQNTRTKGSHFFFRHPDGRTTVVPFHKGEDISVGLIAKIIKDCEVSREEFYKFL